MFLLEVSDIELNTIGKEICGIEYGIEIEFTVKYGVVRNVF